MSVQFTHSGLHCPRANKYVHLNKTEHQCRQAHGCGTAEKCPLSEELGKDLLERTFSLYNQAEPQE